MLVEAVLWLAVARVALLVMPFRSIAERLGVFGPPGSGNANVPLVLDRAQQGHVRDVGWAVTRAARRVPFRAVCLPQAIAAKAMLRRRHIDSVLHFSVAKRHADKLEAHAWLDAAGIEVTGFPVSAEFTEVACFR